MKKTILFILLFIFSLTNIFSIIETSDPEYDDVGLNEKEGTYGIPSFMRNNQATLYFGAGTDDYLEVGGIVSLDMVFPQFAGLFFETDFYLSKTKIRDPGSEFDKIGGILLYYGEACLGIKNKYVTLKVGFQDLVSSDAIYNHLIIDDYSGSFFAIKLDLWLSRFVDIDLAYTIIRPHQTDWSNSYPSTSFDYYQGLYGKTLFFKKINFRPLPWLRIGIQDSVYFMGENFNMWFSNPFYSYFFMMGLPDYFEKSSGSSLNTNASDIKMGLDINIGFKGWRIYSEVMLDDWDGSFILFREEIFPARVAFLLGGELRGYLFTKHIRMPKIAEFFLSNLYFNIEYGITSKYTYSRDPNNNYEYIRQEYTGKYNANNPPTQSEIDRLQREGNFIGFMYGSNADCLDIAIGWRNDLDSVKEYTADYQGDIYFDSFKKKKIVNRLFKVQLHYRHYRLGDGRNAIMPFYMNEHYLYDNDEDFDSDGNGDAADDKSNRRTEFLDVVLEEGNIFDIAVYSDIFKFNRFTLGAETKFIFKWITADPWSTSSATEFKFQWNFGLSIYW